MSRLHVAVDGLGLWAPDAAGIDALRALLAGEPPPPAPPRPPAGTLPPNERRRAPESVLLAAEVAGQAVAASGRGAAELACVFASSHGDQGITDYMCATLAQAPTELSPTKFHNSVHNAPVGYWTIATGCHAPSNAVCAHHRSFGAGLLEAAVLVAADRRPVLLTCSDVPGAGPLQEMTGCTASFAAAFVLAPEAGAGTLATLAMTVRPGSPEPVQEPPPLAAWRRGSPAAQALDLLVPLLRRSARAAVAAGPGLLLDLTLEFPA